MINYNIEAEYTQKYVNQLQYINMLLYWCVVV